jgi:hypothetical protein
MEKIRSPSHDAVPLKLEYNAIAAGPPRFVFSVFLASTFGMTHSFAVLGESCGNWQRQSDSVDEGKQ